MSAAAGLACKGAGMGCALAIAVGGGGGTHLSPCRHSQIFLRWVMPALHTCKGARVVRTAPTLRAARLGVLAVLGTGQCCGAQAPWQPSNAPDAVSWCAVPAWVWTGEAVSWAAGLEHSRVRGKRPAAFPAAVRGSSYLHEEEDALAGDVPTDPASQGRRGGGFAARRLLSSAVEGRAQAGCSMLAAWQLPHSAAEGRVQHVANFFLHASHAPQAAGITRCAPAGGLGWA